MVVIRLQRLGKRNRPHYRVVVADSRRAAGGKVLDILGHYDPIRKEDFRVDTERAMSWISRGAKPTPRVKAVLKLERNRTGTNG